RLEHFGHLLRRAGGEVEAALAAMAIPALELRVAEEILVSLAGGDLPVPRLRDVERGPEAPVTTEGLELLVGSGTLGPHALHLARPEEPRRRPGHARARRREVDLVRLDQAETIAIRPVPVEEAVAVV